MSFKILERNGVDNENIDGAAFNNFAAGERDGIVAGVLSQCSIYYEGNVIGISSGELIIHGFRIKITETETISVSSTPVTATKYQIIAQIVCGDNNDVSFSMFVRLPSVLKKDEIFKNNRGTYQMEFGTFIHNPDGRVTELTRTASVFYSDIHNSAIIAEQAAKAAEESAENALIAAEKAVMDIPMSEQQTGAFIHGENTLKGAITKVEVQSKNLVDLSKTPLGGGVTILGREDNSITFRADREVTSMYQGFPLEGITEGEITASAEWTTSGNGDPTLALWWHYNRTFPNEGLVAFTKTSGGAITAKLKKPTEDAVLYIMLYVTRDIPAVIGDTTTFTNVLVERGNTKTVWTKPLPENTAVNFTACGKNLIPFPYYQSNKTINGITWTINEDGTVTANGTATNTSIFIIRNFDFMLPAGTYCVSGAKDGVINTTYYIQLATENYAEAWNATNNTVFTLTKLEKMIVQLVVHNGATINNCTFEPQIERGTVATAFEPYNGQNYSSQVGQTAAVTQYDKVTNIFATTEGGAVSTQFFLSTEYELNDKVNLLVGTLANRPTTTQAYGVIYIATDQTGATRVTYLPPSTDGSVSGNWISFNS